MGRRDRDPALCPVVARRARQERSLHAAGAGAAGGCAPRFHHARSPEDRVRRHRAPRDGAAQGDRAADRGVPGPTGGAKAPGAQPAAIGARGGERGRLELKALLLDGARRPLRTAEIPRPEPGPGQILLAVRACGVCRTDLHVLDGELPDPKLPLVLGHEIVGTVAGVGPGSERFTSSQRLGVPWLGWTCGVCRYCRSGRENLCDRVRFTGYQLDGGYAEYAVADERFCFPLPDAYRDVEAAPLLCAGLIGYRSLVAAGDAPRLGLYGFGASAQQFARALGAEWAGASEALPPEPLDAAIIFAPAGALVPVALRAVAKGGTVVCAGIHMSDIPTFRYDILWGERVLRSVANLTRRDGEEFLALAPRVPVRTTIEPYPLERANEALERLRAGQVRGAAVLEIAR